MQPDRQTNGKCKLFIGFSLEEIILSKKAAEKIRFLPITVSDRQTNVWTDGYSEL